MIQAIYLLLPHTVHHQPYSENGAHSNVERRTFSTHHATQFVLLPYAVCRTQGFSYSSRVTRHASLVFDVANAGGICYVPAMENVLALGFSFVIFVIGLAFLITGRVAVGLLLIAASLFLAWLAFRRRREVVVQQRIEIGGDVSTQLLKCRNCGAELKKEAMEVRLGAVFISCPYCHSQYQIEEEPKW